MHKSLILCSLFVVAPALADERPPELFVERPVASVPAGLEAKSDYLAPLFNRDGTNVVYIARYRTGNDIRECVVVGETRGPEFDFVSRPVFNPDGETVAYLGTLNTESGLPAYLVIGDRWDEIQAAGGTQTIDPTWEPVFDATGTKLAYKRERLLADGTRGQSIVVADVPPNRQFHLEPTFGALEGTPGPGFRWVGEPEFGPDGSWVAYVAREKLVSFVVVGEKKGPEFDAIGWLRVGPDGTIAYGAQKDNHAFLVLDGVKGREFDQIYEARFSADGRRVTYPARTGNDALIIVGTHSIPASRFFDEVVFNTDGDRVVGWAFDRGRRRIIVGNTEFPKFKRVDWPVFDASLTAVVYWAQDGGGYRIVAGSIKGPKFDEIGREPGRYPRPQVVFSPDARKIAYGARKGRELSWNVLEIEPQSFQVISVPE